MAIPLATPRHRLPLLLMIAAALGLAVYAMQPRTAPAPVSPAITTPAAPIVAPPPPVPPMPASPAPAPPPAVPQRGSIPGLSVNATFATRSGGGGILVTRADGSRSLVPAGSDVVPGVRLTAVAIDRATFATGGTIFWLPLLSESAAKAAPAPATPIVMPAATPPPPAAVSRSIAAAA